MASLPSTRFDPSDFQAYTIGVPTFEVVIQLPQDRDTWYIHSQHPSQIQATETALDLMKIAQLKIRVICSVFDGVHFQDKVLLNTRTADEAVWRRMFTTQITTAIHRQLHRLRGQNDGLKVKLGELSQDNQARQRRLGELSRRHWRGELATAVTFLLIGALLSAAAFIALH